MSTSPNVIDVTISNFEQAVILGSQERPVLVDFWATWCEPCKTLGPVLERVTEDMGGAVLLAKVDIDANPEIAQAFRVQSVPTVVLLSGGQPLDAFTGVKSDKELREFLSAHVLPANDGNPLEAAKEIAAAGHLAGAMEMLEAWLVENPGDGPVRTALAGFLLDGSDAPGARAQYELLAETDRDTAEGRSVAARLELVEGAGDVDVLRQTVDADPKDVGARIELGKALVAAGNTELGLEELLEAAMRDMQFEDGAPRKALIEVFKALGPSHPLTMEFQQRLSVLLCS